MRLFLRMLSSSEKEGLPKGLGCFLPLNPKDLKREDNKGKFVRKKNKLYNKYIMLGK